jgi:hypothetical protein
MDKPQTPKKELPPAALADPLAALKAKFNRR